MNALWSYLCSWGLSQDGDFHPLPLDQFWQHLNEGLQFDRLGTQLQVSAPDLNADSSFEELLQWLLTIVGAVIGGMLVILSLIYLRFQVPDHWQHPAWEISRMGQDGRLSVADFMHALRYRLQSRSTSIRHIVQWLYNDYIILQHQLVAASKLPENTFRFQREGDRMRFFRLENGLGFTDSRFHALSTTIHELGLCGNLYQPLHSLTQDGKRLWAEGDLTCGT